MSRIKNLIINMARRLVYGPASSPDRFISHLIKSGVEIGEGTVFFDPVNTIVDTQNPKLLKLGRNVRITSGVIILTHDFSWSVIAGVTGDCVGGVAPVKIGNNVFVGVNSVILKGTLIGDNVIIGAGSIVSGKLESNSVYAGNPVRKIMSLDEFYKKKINKNETVIMEILAHINTSDKEEVWKYLREYSCQFEDSPFVVAEQIMIDSGYKEKCLDYNKKANRPFVLNNLINSLSCCGDDVC